jgi:hypothetical protein
MSAETTEQPKAEPLEELVLELSDLKFHDEDGGPRRASSRARLVYEPATAEKREVRSPQSWRFIAPIGPIEAAELRWYLEKFAIWPSEYFRNRARKVEENLVRWGQLLHETALPIVHTVKVLQAWAQIGHPRRPAFLRGGRLLARRRSTPPPNWKPPANARRSSTASRGSCSTTATPFLFQGAKPRSRPPPHPERAPRWA